MKQLERVRPIRYAAYEYEGYVRPDVLVVGMPIGARGFRSAVIVVEIRNVPHTHCSKFSRPDDVRQNVTVDLARARAVYQEFLRLV
eukprot:SAG31_NODE_2310_length_5960_cov_5.846613_2_plen_86_part_00